MRRFAIGEAFDEWPMPEVNSEALDFRAASESFAPVRRLRRRNLETLRLLTPSAQVPARAGLTGRREIPARRQPLDDAPLIAPR